MGKSGNASSGSSGIWNGGQGNSVAQVASPHGAGAPRTLQRIYPCACPALAAATPEALSERQTPQNSPVAFRAGEVVEKALRFEPSPHRVADHVLLSGAHQAGVLSASMPYLMSFRNRQRLSFSAHRATPRSSVTPKDVGNPVSGNHVKKAGELHVLLSTIQRKNAVWAALRAVWAALTSYQPDLRSADRAAGGHASILHLRNADSGPDRALSETLLP
jgi:hypothetical protein